jgi:tetratricopeptide (TPR) repeat protein
MPEKRPPAGTPPQSLVPAWRADWLALAGGAVIAAGAIAVYSRTFSAPLLFDDESGIVDNPTIRHLGTAFWPPLNTTASGRPVLNFSLAVNYAVNGTAVWSYHVLNLAIHVLAGLTLFGVVRRTLARSAAPAAFLIAFAAALFWTLHPLQTEAVTYTIQRAESLMGLFYLLTLYCFIRGAEGNGRRQRLWSALCVGACLLGMATKEVMVSAPLIVLLYDRTFVAGSFREAWRRRSGLHLALAATWLPLVGLVASTGWDRSGTSGFGVGIAPWAYWLTQFEAVTRYLWLSLWPHPLVLDYGTVWVGHPADAAPYAAVVVALAVLVLIALQRWPAAGFLGAWFFAILAPTSVMPGRIQMIVEHRMYLPLAAVIVTGVAGLDALRRTMRDHGRRDTGTAGRGLISLGSAAGGRAFCGPVVAAALILSLATGLGLITARRNEDYRSKRAIWGDTAERRPNNERAHFNLANALAKTPGRMNDAIAHYDEALRLKPDYAEAHNNLADALARIPARLNDAIAQYDEALRLKPDYAQAHNNLGVALEKMPGRMNDAIAHYEEALRVKPDYAEAHNNLGLALSRMGRTNDAIAHYEEALRLNPGYAQAHNNLGVALEQIPGRLNDAIAQYEETLRLKPDSAEAHGNLGLVWSRIPGRINDAVAQYEAVVRLQPDDAPGWHNLGVNWYRLGNLPAAAAAFREELRLSPDDPAARKALSTVLRQSSGRPDGGG